MTVEVEGYGDAAMPQQGLRHFRGHALFQGPGGEGVTCVVDIVKRKLHPFGENYAILHPC